ncbi:MAG: hypothetical protein RL336_161 [Pseudomonadota bacterium]|jgi:HPt (histidine-containing phosphotransfer) domain-containing protein
MLEKLFSRASEGGLLWLGTPSESHRRLFSDASIHLATMPNSFETLCALETIRQQKHALPVVIVDVEVANRDHHCLAETTSKVAEYSNLYTVLFGKSEVSETLYSQVIYSTRELIKGSNVLIEQQSVYGQSIPEGVNASGRVLVIEKSSTNRLIAKGLLSSLSVEHDIVETMPNYIDLNRYGVVFIAYEQYHVPDVQWLIDQPVRKVIMGGQPTEGLEHTSVPLREKELVSLLKRADVELKTLEQPGVGLANAQELLAGELCLDVASISSRLNLSEDIARLVLVTYRGDLDKQMTALNKAQVDENPVALKAVAHKIKGASLSVGAHEISAFAAILESRVAGVLHETTLSTAVKDSAQQLTELLAEIKRNLDEYFSQEGAHG